jgi:hypothetical protein
MTYEATYTGAELGHRFPEIVVDLFARKKTSIFKTQVTAREMHFASRS